MGELLQALEIMFEEVQSKGINEKITRKINFPTYKTQFYFLFFEPLLLSNFIPFLFFIYF
jgi:hypothetical protein